MSRLALLVLGIVLGLCLVLVPLQRGWLAPESLQAMLHPFDNREEAGEATTGTPGDLARRPSPGYPATPAPKRLGPDLPPLSPPPLPEDAHPGTEPPVGNQTHSPPSSAQTAQAPATSLPAPPGQALLVPVKGVLPTQLSDTFTQSRGEGRRHDAIDIMAPRGTPVLAVADGRIEKLFLSKPGGRTIYQFDPGGTRAYYYAHLDSYVINLSEGQVVKRGQILGYVGSTGNASPDAPHLHFAVFELGPEKQWWKGTAINPYPLLGGS